MKPAPVLLRLLRYALPPLLAFVAARAVLWATAAGAGANVFSPDAWAFSDSDHYLSIAQRGYELFPCEKIGFGKPGWWCGNDAWFPGYAWLIKLVAALGVRPVTAGVWLSAVFALGSLCLLWIAWLRAEVRASNLLVLALAALFPGLPFAHGVFPNAMVGFLALLFLFGLARERFVLAAIAGFLAGLTYSTAFMLAPIATVWALASPRGTPWRTRIWRAFITAGPVTLGVLTVFLVMYLYTGAWDAFFRVQGKYDPGLYAPLNILTRKLHGLGEPTTLQLLFVGFVVVTLTITTELRWRRAPESADRADWLIVLYGVAYWLLPLSQGVKVSSYRADALLFPLALLARHLPLTAQGFLVFGAGTISSLLGALFFRKLIE